MKHRSPVAVFFLSLITFGIYSIYWQVKTKGELTALGADIPSSWLIIVPFANLIWLWKYSQGVEKVSNGKISAAIVLIMLLLLSIVGLAILQGMFNDLGGVASVAALPGQPAASDNGVFQSAPAVSTPAAIPTTNPMPPVAQAPTPPAGQAPDNTPLPPPPTISG